MRILRMIKKDQVLPKGIPAGGIPAHPSRNGWERLVLELLPLHEDDGLRLGILGADLLQAPSHRQQLGAVRPQLRRQRLGRGGGHFHLARA